MYFQIANSKSENRISCERKLECSYAICTLFAAEAGSTPGAATFLSKYLSHRQAQPDRVAPARWDLPASEQGQYSECLPGRRSAPSGNEPDPGPSASAWPARHWQARTVVQVWSPSGPIGQRQ